MQKETRKTYVAPALVAHGALTEWTLQAPPLIRIEETMNPGCEEWPVNL